jgi:hypothetical protein
MPPAVRSLSATPRWPATGERFEAGWSSLPAARPLLDHLASGGADPTVIEAALTETLRRVHAAVDADVLALLVVEETRDAPPAAVLRRVIRREQEVSDPPALAVAVGTPVVPRLADGLAHLVTPTLAVEVPLARGPDGAPPAGFVVAFAAGQDGLDQWAERARSVLEEIAWVLGLCLRQGWQAWRTAGAWPGLTPGELALCRAALVEARRTASTQTDRQWDPTAWPRPADSAPRPRAVDENVQFTVFRPRRIPVETWCTVLAFAHLAERRPDAPPDTTDPVEEVRRQAAQVLGDAAARYVDTTQDSAEAIPRAGEITFALDLPDLEVNPRQRSFRWLEDIQREEFHVRAPRALDGTTVRGALRVYLGAIVVAEVALALRVENAASTAPDVESEHARPYRRIFPSYSHLDESIVQQVEAYARTLGDEYLRDVTHLRSGEVWSERLADFIRTADVFQLFWSRNSMASTWVRREWEYALSLGRPFFIRPTYWETPMPEAPDLPPPALRELHFQRLPVALERTDGAPLAAPEESVQVPPPAAAPPPRAAPPPPAPAPGSAPATAAPPRVRGRRPWRPRFTMAALLLVGMVGAWNYVRTGAHGDGRGGETAGPPPPTPAGSERPADRSEQARPHDQLAAVSPDGTLAVVMDAAARLVVSRRDATGTVERVIPTTLARADVVALRFSSDGRRVVCETRDGSTTEWDLRTGERVSAAGPLPTGHVLHAAWTSRRPPLHGP